MYNLSSMVVTVNQAKIKNKQQHYHSLQTQASLENYNNNNTTIAFTTIISFREHKRQKHREERTNYQSWMRERLTKSDKKLTNITHP